MMHYSLANIISESSSPETFSDSKGLPITNH